MNSPDTHDARRARLFYIGDNRNRENWGCRATSAALETLLSQVGDVFDRCDGAEAASSSRRAYLYSTWIPLRMAAAAGSLWRYVRRWAWTRPLARLFPDDYINGNLAHSVRAFTRYAARYPHLRRIRDAIAAADAVVINGEGSMIFGTPMRRDAMFFLVLLEVARTLGKRTYYLNAMISDCPRTGRNKQLHEDCRQVLSQCTRVVTRDRTSLEILHEMGVRANATYLPDALFTWLDDVRCALGQVGGSSAFYAPFGGEMIRESLDLGQPYICVSGSSRAVSDLVAAYQAYDRLVTALQEVGIPLLIVPTCAGDAFLERLAMARGLPRLDKRMPIKLGAAVLAKAAVFVSGRFHPSILASLGGTPCVFLGSNSHKTFSLQAVLGYENPVEFAAYPSQADCDAIAQRVRTYLSGGEALRTSLRARSMALAKEAQEVVTLIRESCTPMPASPEAPACADAIR